MFLALTTLALAGTLDGRSYTATVTDPQKKADADVLTFANDTFSSNQCTQWGFVTSPYVVAADGTVTTDQVSATEGTIHWTLKVTGDTVAGTMEWAKPGQANIRYVVAGTLKK